MIRNLSRFFNQVPEGGGYIKINLITKLNLIKNNYIIIKYIIMLIYSLESYMANPFISIFLMLNSFFALKAFCLLIPKCIYLIIINCINVYFMIASHNSLFKRKIFCAKKNISTLFVLTTTNNVLKATVLTILSI